MKNYLERAGKRQVWPGHAMKLTVGAGMKPASFFSVGKRAEKKRASVMT